MARTLAEYFEESKVQVHGGPDYFAARRVRMAAMIVDGRPVGEYETIVLRDYEGWKRFEELQWLALAMVSCDADLEFREYRSLVPRPGRATPDFEAVRADGGVVRIEIFRLIDKAERLYLDAIARIAAGAQAHIEASAPTASGQRFVHFYDAVPTRRDVTSAVPELAAFILSDPRLRRPSLTLWKAGPEYPTLHRLNAHVAFDDPEGSLRVIVRPDRSLANQAATVEAFYTLVDKKRQKFSEYSDGCPVWLACAVKTQLFYPLGTIQELGQDANFDPRPFERVLAGCFTAGVTFEQPFEPPRRT